jgi:hypothetical protein
MENKIKQFIEKNKLSFSDTGSGLNSECCILAGYSLYLGCKNSEEVTNVIDETLPAISKDYKTEFDRVFIYAKDSSYGNYWSTEEAKKMYKF